ncbi:MAG TPA: ATP-binding protein [Candidatus Onthousia faecavium]|nr:ATP-binding protein [Candidatus Onthousia faecavium]
MYAREATAIVERISKTFKVLLVTGPRQVGKTTLLLSIKPDNMEYITLDDEVFREQAKNDPKLFLEEHPAPLLIDEVQYAPNLFSYIKINVDKENKNGMYWLTGSQQFHLMKNVGESLAGRVGIINLNSLMYSEIVENNRKELFDPAKLNEMKTMPKIDVNKLYEIIYKGGMPTLYMEKEMSRDIYFSSYVDTYISRDVRELTEIGNELSFRKFIISVASRTGEQLNYTALATDALISVPTAVRWMSILVTSGLVYLLEPYMNSELKRITHLPKIVFMDTGLSAYLSGYTSARELQLSSNSGHYLETFIVSEIIKAYNARGITPNLYYYRDKEKNEIDLIFYKNNKLYPLEIKKTAIPKKEMIKNFSKLDKTKKEIGTGGIICFYDILTKLDESNYIIPISNVINYSVPQD